MNAIIVAGGVIQPSQPLYEAAQGGLKSMIEINGKPMVQWVLDALNESTCVERVVVVGLPLETDLVCRCPLVMVPDNGGMIQNLRAGAQEVARIDPAATHALVASGDLPALRGEVVDWLARETRDLQHDLCYAVIDRATMEAQFPGSRRTYLHLKDVEVCGGDLFSLRLQVAVDDDPIWKRLADARKSPLRQASLLGYDTVFFLLLRQLNLQNAETMVSKRLGIKGRVLVSPYAEIGMDVDKPFQLAMMREHLAKRSERDVASSD